MAADAETDASGSCSGTPLATAVVATTAAVLAGALEDLAEVALVAVSAVDLEEATLAVAAPAEAGNLEVPYEKDFKCCRISEFGMAEAL